MKWLISLVNKFFGLLRSEPSPSHGVLKIYLVRSGDYEVFGLGRPITREGWDKAKTTGEQLRAHIGGGPVIFMRSPTYSRTSAYATTLRTISEAWGKDMPVRDYHNVLDLLFYSEIPSPIPNILGGYLQEVALDGRLSSLNGVSIICVINGSTLRDRITQTPGPNVDMDVLGPDFASAHEFRVTYSTRNGRIVTITRETI